MAETEKKILTTINQALQRMTDGEKERLLSFSEGMAYMAMTSSTQPAAPPLPELASLEPLEPAPIA